MTKSYKNIYPATGEVLQDLDSHDNEELEARLAKAHEAFRAWRETTLTERREVFSRIAGIVDRDAENIARQITLDMGKPLKQSVGELAQVASIFRYYEEHAERLLADEEVSVPGASRTFVRREPVGVILGVEPWNGPVYQAARAAAPNLMLGNTVLVKPAEISAASTLMLDSVFREAGVPDGVYSTVLIDTQQVSDLIKDPRVRGVTLTGSDAAGAAVGRQAGEQIKPVVLELGGSDAFVVLDSADVARAAKSGAICRLAIGGQVCASPKRVIVTEAVADEFTEKYLEVFGNQVVGDPLDPATTVGPLSSQAAVDTLQEQYEDAVAKGATVLLEGGKIEGRDGFYFQPAVLTDITPDMRLYYEEAFGPLAMIYRVKDADEAVQQANDSRYGLGGTVYAEDLDEARRVATLMDTGSVGISRWIGAPTEIPFGGKKASGVGRELGSVGMDQFANLKTYSIA